MTNALGTSRPKDPAAGPPQAFLLGSPSPTLPKGGGATRGIGEKFSAQSAMGTGSMSVPLPITPRRAGFNPTFALQYDSGAGQDVFGLGWQIGMPTISRKTEKGLPQYGDAVGSDVFLIAGAEDLVPVTAAGKRPVPGAVRPFSAGDSLPWKRLR